MNEMEKKQVMKDVLGAKYHSVGQHFSLYSRMADGLGHVNNALSFAELIPALNCYLSGALASKVVSNASFIGILMFPFEQIVNLINANETGFRMYSYRAIAYSITAWAFEKPIPNGSKRTLDNLQSGSGPVVRDHAKLAQYHKVWSDTANQVVRRLEETCRAKNIPKNDLKMVFRALGRGNAQQLCKELLLSFEGQFGHTTKHIWRSNCNWAYPM